MKKFNLKAFAKINLGLEVLYKRSDGFHEINTIFARTNLFDEIEISASDSISVECEPPLNIPETDNLAYKAVTLLNKKQTKSYGAKILIKKNIPSGGGLGGGSSDAASVLLGLVELYNINIIKEDLHDIACELGSDVPYFLEEGSAHAKGRGEILSYFDYQIPYHILLVFPGIHIDTGKAYGSLNRNSDIIEGSDLKAIIAESVRNPEVLKNKLKNDFEDYVFGEYPEIEKIKDTLFESGSVFSLMSGSGSTVYGLFDDIAKAESAAEHLPYNCYMSKIQGTEE